MKPRAVDFVSYSVTDMARSEAFYRDVLGLDVEVSRGEPGTRICPRFFRPGGCGHPGVLASRREKAPRLTRWHHSFQGFDLTPVRCSDRNHAS